MNPEEFIKEVRSMYIKARNLKYEDSNISRGRSHFISSATEDLVAFYLAQHLKRGYHLYVDQPIRLRGRRNARYIDILVTKENVIENIIDVKMDLGWHRDGFNYNKVLELLNEIRDNKIGMRKEELIGSKKCRYHYVLISRENITEAGMKKVIGNLSIYKNDISYYILSRGIHPNAYIDEKNLCQAIQINKDEFERLVKNINN